MLTPLANMIDGVRLFIGVAALALILVFAGAVLERQLIKRRLEVLEGGEAGGGSA